MAISKDSYSKYLESKGQSGYGAAILVSETGDGVGKYSLLAASETVPTIFGSNDSFEFDLLNSSVKGKIAGKMSLEDKEVEVLHHRDNVYRFEKLKDRTLNFMVIDSQFVGYKFTGTVSYRMNDASADVLRGTYTITPMSAEPTPILNARPYCIETLCFSSGVPDEINAGTVIDLEVVQDVTATFTASLVAENGTESPDASVMSEGKKFTAPSAGGLYAITATATGYASWTTTVYCNPGSST